MYSIGFRDYWRGWSAELNASTLSHRKDCELFKYLERENSFNLKLMYFGAIIKQVVTASIHLTRGAGGFSISPSLSCIRVVPYDSPAFYLLDRVWEHCELSSVDDFIAKLQGLFQDGLASPRDVDPCGRSLLHVGHHSTAPTSYLTKHCIKCIFDKFYFWKLGGFSEDELGCILENLCRLDVPVNEVNHGGRYVLFAVNLIRC